MIKVVLTAVAQNGAALAHATRWLRGERDFVIAATALNPCALAHAVSVI